jgi:hypothetical protein
MTGSGYLLGRNITTRFKEHIRNIRPKKDESAFAQHITKSRSPILAYGTNYEISRACQKG